MKKIIFILSLVFFTIYGHAQNVGIGTETPAGKFQVNHRSNGTTPHIVLYDSAASGGGSILFRNAGSRNWIQSVVLGAVASSQYFDFRTDSLYVLTMRGNGNVGIGNLSPANKLDVSGDVNLSGVLKIDNNAGSTGKMLQSNGTSSPSWINPTNLQYNNIYADYLSTATGVSTAGPTGNVLPRTIILTGNAKVTVKSKAILNGTNIIGRMQTIIAPAAGASTYSSIYFVGASDDYATPSDEITLMLPAGSYNVSLTFYAHAGSSSFIIFDSGSDFLGNTMLGTRVITEIIYQ